MPSDGEHRGAHRLSLPGRLVTGVMAIVLAINASLDSEYVGVGVLLIAAALAFGHVSRAAEKHTTRRSKSGLPRRRDERPDSGPMERGLRARVCVGGAGGRRLSPLPGLFEPVTLAVHLQALHVVGEAIEQRPCEALGAEHVRPLVEGQVA